jgi:hypothetical protein
VRRYRGKSVGLVALASLSIYVASECYKLPIMFPTQNDLHQSVLLNRDSFLLPNLHEGDRIYRYFLGVAGICESVSSGLHLRDSLALQFPDAQEYISGKPVNEFVN